MTGGATAVLTSAESSARDRSTIAAGVESFDLMRRAGDRAAHLLLTEYRGWLASGALVLVGPGNNGGDGWIVAHALARAGIEVSVDGAEPRTPDAVRARESGAGLPRPVAGVVPGVVLDAILGTGAEGPLRQWAADLTARARAHAERGARVVAIDVPTGLNASTGEADDRGIVADATITFGALKRGQLARRDLAGEIRCLDIGLRPPDTEPPVLVDAEMVRGAVPPFRVDDHKGSRRRVMIVGGAPGFAGASVLAARGALRSGVGMIRFAVHEASIPAVQSACVEAVALDWASAREAAAMAWPHAIVIGPGLGLDRAVQRVSEWLEVWPGPAVVDADALSAFAGSASALSRLVASRSAIVTPHLTEAARLLDATPDEVAADRYAAAEALSRRLGCAVLLKGVPTLIARGGRVRFVVPRGNPVLATGGSGDLLAGICGTLLAQLGDPALAAACAAWVHGRAAEIAATGRPWRGTVLADVADALGEAWRVSPERLAEHELARLPAVREA